MLLNGVLKSIILNIPSHPQTANTCSSLGENYMSSIELSLN